MRHAGAVEVFERDAPAHSAVQEGEGAEAKSLSSVGGAVGHLQDIQHL